MYTYKQSEVSEVNETAGEGLPQPQARKHYKIAKAASANERDIVRALECFLNTDDTKARFNHYFIDGNELFYRTVVTNRRQMELKENTIARKTVQNGEVIIIGNSSALSLIGREVHYGRESLNTGETEVQRRLALCVPMLPFSVFEQAKLDLDSLQIIERGPEETITRKHESDKRDKAGNKVWIDETVHFTGASLFSIDGTAFLFDVDRRELEYKVFNPFLVRLPSAAGSIAEAYEILKPEPVVAALAKGQDVKRQGEFFFIPVSALEAKRLSKLAETEGNVIPLELRAGQNRPNTAKGIQLVDGKPVPDMQGMAWNERNELRKTLRGKSAECFITGKVEHTGREHAALILRGWYRAFPNTATQSFTITGDID